MKALVIQVIHSWSPFHLLVENNTFVGACVPFWGMFSDRRSHLGSESVNVQNYSYPILWNMVKMI